MHPPPDGNRCHRQSRRRVHANVRGYTTVHVFPAHSPMHCTHACAHWEFTNAHRLEQATPCNQRKIGHHARPKRAWQPHHATTPCNHTMQYHSASGRPCHIVPPAPSHTVPSLPHRAARVHIVSCGRLTAHACPSRPSNLASVAAELHPHLLPCTLPCTLLCHWPARARPSLYHQDTVSVPLPDYLQPQNVPKGPESDPRDSRVFPTPND